MVEMSPDPIFPASSLLLLEPRSDHFLNSPKGGREWGKGSRSGDLTYSPTAALPPRPRPWPRPRADATSGRSGTRDGGRSGFTSQTWAPASAATWRGSRRAGPPRGLSPPPERGRKTGPRPRRRLEYLLGEDLAEPHDGRRALDAAAPGAAGRRVRAGDRAVLLLARRSPRTGRARGCRGVRARSCSPPGRWRPSTFCVARVKRPPSRRSSPREADVPLVGRARGALHAPGFVERQTLSGSRAHALGWATSSIRWPSHRPPAPRKVAMPLSAEMPAPVRTAIEAVLGAEMSWVHPRRRTAPGAERQGTGGRIE